MRTIAGPPSRLAGDDGSQAFAEKWLDSWMQQPKNISGVLSDTVAGDVDLLQGRLLLNVDRRYEGLLYLNRVFDRYKGDPGVLKLTYRNKIKSNLPFIHIAKTPKV